VQASLNSFSWPHPYLVVILQSICLLELMYSAHIFYKLNASASSSILLTAWAAKTYAPKLFLTIPNVQKVTTRTSFISIYYIITSYACMVDVRS
jgi:hypothetical protein